MQYLIFGLAALATQALGRIRDPAGFEDGSDLERYVSRPDLAVPRYKVTKHHPNVIAPGYWFVAPYAGLKGHPPYEGRREHSSYQIGAHIYDADANLIWSGAERYNNRNIFGFKPITYKGKPHLSLYISGEDLGDEFRSDAAVVILNDSYEEVARSNDGWYDLHEFNVFEDSQTALVTTNRWQDHNATEIGQGKRVVANTGFREIDLISGNTLFDWDALAGGVKVNESYDAVGMAEDYDGTWDFFHINAVDKFANGDYLVSARHTSTIYRLSGTSGKVKWRLGGFASDFATQDDDLEFVWQHHVRVWSDNTTHTLISVFDNHGDDEGRNPLIPERTSAVKFIMLDTKHMTAEVIRRIDRPDGGVSHKLGNVQVLAGEEDIKTATLLIEWGLEGYLSEHTAFDLVMEAKFVSDRMSSYRGYKSAWVGRPKLIPALKILPMATSDGVRAAFYTSWNGATEVASWTFYGCDNKNGPCGSLGNATRSGFETSFVAPYLVRYGYVEAFDKRGESLQRSGLVTMEETALARYGIGADAESIDAANLKAEATKAEAQDEASGRTAGMATGLWESISPLSLTVDVFALFGLVSLVRMLLPLVHRWRHGYKRLEVDE